MIKKIKTDGIVLALVASIISGIAIFYAKISLVKIEPLILTTGRNLTAGLLLAIAFGLSANRQEIRKLNKQQLINLILVAFIGGALPFYLFFSGLQFVKAPVANLIHKTLFIWVSVLASIFLKERLNIKYWISFGLIFLANFYFARIPLNPGKGEMMILVATILWSTENILAKKALTALPSEMVGFFRMGVGSILLSTAVLFNGKGAKFLTLSYEQLTVIIIGGLILFLYVYFWYKALKYAPASLATLILSFSVLVGNILNNSFAGVRLFPNDIFSLTLISLAVLLIFAGPGFRPHRLKFDGKTNKK